MRSQCMRQLSAKLTPSWSKHVFALRTKTVQHFSPCRNAVYPQPPLQRLGVRKNPLRRNRARMRCENRLELQRHKKAGKSPLPLNITLNAAALGSFLAEGLRDSMNASFTGLDDLIASHPVDEEPDNGNREF